MIHYPVQMHYHVQWCLHHPAKMHCCVTRLLMFWSQYPFVNNFVFSEITVTLFFTPYILHGHWLSMIIITVSAESKWWNPMIWEFSILTYQGWRIYVSVKLTIIGSDNGLSPDRCQAIIWSNAGLLLIWPLGTNFNEILIEIHTFSFKKMCLKMSFGKWRPVCLSLNQLMAAWPAPSHYLN